MSSESALPHRKVHARAAKDRANGQLDGPVRPVDN
jgi:hypothetical protein